MLFGKFYAINTVVDDNTPWKLTKKCRMAEQSRQMMSCASVPLCLHRL
jgi:hypothetical protein